MKLQDHAGAPSGSRRDFLKASTAVEACAANLNLPRDVALKA
jgi:hypothetical protein